MQMQANSNTLRQGRRRAADLGYDSIGHYSICRWEAAVRGWTLHTAAAEEESGRKGFRANIGIGVLRILIQIN